MSDRITRLKKLLRFDSSHYPLGTVMTARQENARLTPLLDAMVECVNTLGELLNSESEINEKRVAELNRKYSVQSDFVIGGEFRKNAAYYSGDASLTNLDEAIEAAGKESELDRVSRIADEYEKYLKNGRRD